MSRGARRRVFEYNDGMMNAKKIFLFLFLFLSSCSLFPSREEPNYILTVVAATQEAAAYLTQRARDSYSPTPTVVALRATMTLQATSTVFVLATKSPVPSPTPTKTPYLRTTWPDWKTGDVIKMPSGTGANAGTNKKFSGLTGLQVIVVRLNGVKLRSSPNKADAGVQEERGSAFVLTGVMHKNPQFGWLFVQVIAADGNTYWVGGSEDDENSDPRYALEFYYPKLTPSPTITQTPVFLSSPVPTRTPAFIIP